MELRDLNDSGRMTAPEDMRAMLVELFPRPAQAEMHHDMFEQRRKVRDDRPSRRLGGATD
jgi:hypothetical protein